MDTDYTTQQPVVASLQEALDLALGPGRLKIGGRLNASSVDDVSAVLYAAERYDGKVTIGPSRKGYLAVGLDELNSVREIDAMSATVTAEAGVTISALESALSKAGLCIEKGHFNNPSDTLGDVLAAGDGLPLVVSIEAVLPDGAIFHTPIAPRRATGPNPDALLVGTANRLAVITAAVLRARPCPSEPFDVAFCGPGLATLETTRLLLRAGVRSTDVLAKKGADGTLTVTWLCDGDSQSNAISQAYAQAGCSQADVDVKATITAPGRRLSWSELDALVEDDSVTELWVAPMDVYGGLARVSCGGVETDSMLRTVSQAADPQETLS